MEKQRMRWGMILMRYKKIIFCVCMLLLPFFASSISIKAYEGITQTAIIYEEGEDDTGNDFIADALRSLDEKTAQQEAGENYLKNFYNSSQTASSESFNIFKPETIVMTLINFLTMVLEMIGILVTFFVMVLFNFVSSSFLVSIVNNVITGIEKTMFDWSNLNSWIIKVIVIATMIGIIYKLVKEFTHIRGYKQVMMIALSGIVSMTFVIFIGRNGRNIIGGIEETLQSTIVETFVFDGQSKNMEIANKENIFDTMQLQPFMLRHFGTTSYEKIASKGGHSIDEAKARVQRLLEDPSTDNAEKEHEDYNNNAISHDIPSTSMILFLSLITLIHKILIGMIIAAICIVVGVIKLLKELLLWLSVYQLILWLIKRNHKAQQWFVDRLMWSFFAIGADILFSMLLYFIMQVCTNVSAIHPLFLIGFDVLLLFIVLYAGKHLGNIAAWLKDNGGDTLKTMLVGSSTPLQVFNDTRNKGKKTNGNNDSDTGTSSDDEITTDEDLSDSTGVSDNDSAGEDLSDKPEADSDETGDAENMSEAEDSDGSENNETEQDQNGNSEEDDFEKEASDETEVDGEDRVKENLSDTTEDEEDDVSGHEDFTDYEEDLSEHEQSDLNESDIEDSERFSEDDQETDGETIEQSEMNDTDLHDEGDQSDALVNDYDDTVTDEQESEESASDEIVTDEVTTDESISDEKELNETVLEMSDESI